MAKYFQFWKGASNFVHQRDLPTHLTKYYNFGEMHLFFDNINIHAKKLLTTHNVPANVNVPKEGRKDI